MDKRTIESGDFMQHCTPTTTAAPQRQVTSAGCSNSPTYYHFIFFAVAILLLSFPDTVRCAAAAAETVTHSNATVAIPTPIHALTTQFPIDWKKFVKDKRHWLHRNRQTPKSSQASLKSDSINLVTFVSQTLTGHRRRTARFAAENVNNAGDGAVAIIQKHAEPHNHGTNNAFIKQQTNDENSIIKAPLAAGADGEVVAPPGVGVNRSKMKVKKLQHQHQQQQHVKNVNALQVYAKWREENGGAGKVMARWGKRRKKRHV